MHIDTQVSIGHRSLQDSSKAHPGAPGWDLMLAHVEVTSREIKGLKVKYKAIKNLQ